MREGIPHHPAGELSATSIQLAEYRAKLQQLENEPEALNREGRMEDLKNAISETERSLPDSEAPVWVLRERQAAREAAARGRSHRMDLPAQHM